MEKPHSSNLEQDFILEELPFGNAFELFNQITSVAHFIYHIKCDKFLYLSNSVENITGHTFEKYLDKGIEFFISSIHEEDFPTLFRTYCDCIEELKSPDFDNGNYCSKTVELRIKHRKGHWIWIEINMVLFDFKDGKWSKLFGIIKDISKSTKSRKTPWKIGQENPNPTGRVQKVSVNQGSVLYGEEVNRSADLPNDISLRANMFTDVTRREKEVLILIADGLSAKEVANKLFISIHTAINHRKNLISKFQVKNTAQLIKVASKYFWL